MSRIGLILVLLTVLACDSTRTQNGSALLESGKTANITSQAAPVSGTVSLFRKRTGTLTYAEPLESAPPANYFKVMMGSHGFPLKEEAVDALGKTSFRVFQYDESGKQIKTIELFRDATATSRISRETFGSDGKLAKTETFDELDKLRKLEQFGTGEQRSIQQFDSKGRKSDWWEEYDEQGKPLKQEFFDAGELVKYWTYTYSGGKVISVLYEQNSLGNGFVIKQRIVGEQP